jgi:hypothetical protein
METHLDPFYKWNADANGDLRVDSSDLSVLGSNWMQSLPAPTPGPMAAAVVPTVVDDDGADKMADRIFAVNDNEDEVSVALGLMDALVDDVCLAKFSRRAILFASRRSDDPQLKSRLSHGERQDLLRLFADENSFRKVHDVRDQPQTGTLQHDQHVLVCRRWQGGS